MNDITNQPRTSDLSPSPARLRRDGGYMLLAIMLMMAIMIIAATAAAPAVVQQMKRDREEEMIHRGTQYARAIKAFYKKNGRYPASLDDLDKGQVKYLRQRYKDPLAKDGKWKLLNYGDIATLLNGAAPGTPAASMGTLGGSNQARFGDLQLGIARRLRWFARRISAATTATDATARWVQRWLPVQLRRGQQWRRSAQWRWQLLRQRLGIQLRQRDKF